MPNQDEIRIRHTLDAARDALSFTAGKERQDLDTDKQLVLAVVKCIEIIGEAATKVSKGFRDGHRFLPWDDIITLRHRLIHAY